MDDLVLCLSDELRLEVTSKLRDSMENTMEEDLTVAIKRMAMLMGNPMVHWNQLRNYRQKEGEKVRGFIARVLEAAIECKFEVEYSDGSCGKMVS